MVNTRKTADQPGDAAQGRSRGVQSVDIALKVLQVIASAPGPMTLKEIGDAARMPASKAHRYLASFVSAGLVTQRHRSGTYDLGRASLELGLAAMARLDIVNDAAAAMEELVAAVDATAMLSVWGNRGPTIVRWERSRNFIVTALGLGTAMPLMRSATGHVFLAHLQRSVTQGVLAEELGSGPSADPQKEPDIRDLIDDVRSNGYASVDGRFIPGLCAVSAPILNWQDEIEAAITLIGTDPRLIDPAAGTIGELTKTCAALSAQRRLSS